MQNIRISSVILQVVQNLTKKALVTQWGQKRYLDEDFELIEPERIPIAVFLEYNPSTVESENYANESEDEETASDIINENEEFENTSSDGSCFQSQLTKELARIC